MVFFSFFFFLFLIACSTTQTKYGDKSINKDEAPSFLINHAPKDPHVEDIEYFKKVTKEGTTFEMKYELNDFEISETFDEQGHFIEKEEDIKFSKLKDEVKNRIHHQLSLHFKSYKIHETEIRTDKNFKKFIDVEVSHKEGPTGLSELSFTLDGNFVSEEVENMPQIETLN